MHNHAPENYICPFCEFLKGRETEFNVPEDIVYQNSHTTAFISPKWWINNPGHVLVVPNKHFENIYAIDDEYIAEVYKTVKKIAIAIRDTYGCDGTSTRQHNEPAGDQDVWHLHVHVFPRYNGDQLYKNHDVKSFADVEQRKIYAEKLKRYFVEH